MIEGATVTEALGYRQEYRRLLSCQRGYRRQIFRVADDVRMYAGPGTDADHPPTTHPEWDALTREERLAIRAVLDADDEQTGVADYLSERASREAVARVASSRGLDPRDWRGREAEDTRRDASQLEYEHVLSLSLSDARDRLASLLRRDREGEALRRLVNITGARDAHDVVLLAINRGLLSASSEAPTVQWLPSRDPRWSSRAGIVGVAGGWTLGTGLVPLGLAELAGLRADGVLGPILGDERQVVAWQTALRHAIGRAEAAASL